MQATYENAVFSYNFARSTFGSVWRAVTLSSTSPGSHNSSTSTSPFFNFVFAELANFLRLNLGILLNSSAVSTCMELRVRHVGEINLGRNYLASSRHNLRWRWLGFLPGLQTVLPYTNASTDKANASNDHEHKHFRHHSSLQGHWGRATLNLNLKTLQNVHMGHNIIYIYI